MLRTPSLRRERDRTLSHRRLGLRAAVGDSRCVLLISCESEHIRWEAITVWCGPPSLRPLDGAPIRDDRRRRSGGFAAVMATPCIDLRCAIVSQQSEAGF